MDQRSPEWIAARLGHATASRMSDILARTKTGYGASRHNYAAQLVAERLTGAAQDSYTSPAMAWGTDTEAEARAVYCFERDVDVAECGFVLHPRIKWSGASPDGLIGDDGLVEIKCPNTSTHIDTLKGGAVPDKYLPQMQWQLACTGRKWCDWVSFDPRMPDPMRLFVSRVQRDDAHIAELEKEVEAFLRGVEETVKALRQRYAEPVNLLRAG